MMINHWNKYMLGLAALLVTPQIEAQNEHCRDTILHHKLHNEMWATCS